LRKLVVDPNVLASGIPWREDSSPPKLLVDAIEDQLFEAVVCPRMVSEVRKTLRKPYFRKRMEDDERESALAMLETAGAMRADPEEIEPLLRDPDDDYLIALAREAGAEAIVSGDKHLLDHAAGLKPEVLDARETCELLGLI
jgi:putative PIN family toxin of toxin-antitoxin system